MTASPESHIPEPGLLSQRVAQITSDLIRIDTTNFGGNNCRGEREAAEYCAHVMSDLGMNPEIIESVPDRFSVIGRLAGWDAEAPALILHGHLDVVPAQAEEWSRDPFSGEIDEDGMIWGRGAVDMKGMDAMMLTALEYLVHNELRPRRDIIVCLFSDEEAGGVYGAQWMVQNRPELLTDATEAISEVGGFSAEIAGQRAYLLQTGEKGIAWLNLTATASPGHGSSVHPDNAVTRLAGAMDRIGHHTWPLNYTKTTRDLMEQVSEMMGVDFDETDPSPQLEALGSAAKFVGSTLRNSANPTGMTAGYKHNVIPGTARGTVDARVLPGEDDKVMEQLRELAGDGIEFDYEHKVSSLEVPFSGDLIELMVAAIEAEDPGARVLPFMMSGGTDNNHLSQLGITGYGFMPLKLPADLDFTALFHGIDERIPVDSLDFGVRTLVRVLEPGHDERNR